MKPEKTPLRATAYERFVDLLMQRRILPGHVVSQRDLVCATGMGLSAVREMIPRLEVEGLIKTVPKKGLEVPVLDTSMISDVFRLRQMLEKEAFIQFCQVAEPAWLASAVKAHTVLKAEVHTGVPVRSRMAHAPTPPPSSELQALHKLRMVRAPDPYPMVEVPGLSPALRKRLDALDTELHAKALRASDNKALQTVHRANAVKVRLVQTHCRTLSPETVTETLEEHLAILYALQARNAGRTAGAVQAHLECARKRALAFFDQQETVGAA